MPPLPDDLRVILPPASSVQRVCRDRRHEKNLFARFNFPHGPFAIVENETDLLPAYLKLATDKNLAVVAKTARGGYDGKGQTWLRSQDDARRAWTDLGAQPLMLEQAVPFIAEASVIVARSPAGSEASFPMLKNEHKNGILFQTVAPAGFSAETEEQARQCAEGIADKLGVVGLLAVEMFVLADGQVRVNELAARPHNSGHLTERATTRSQFELHIAAICNLPLGEGQTGGVRLLRPAVMTNLLGDLWGEDSNHEPNWGAVFAEPRGTLHLSGKKEARPGRKMGHMIHMGEGRKEALAAANEVFAKLADGAGKSPAQSAGAVSG
jgi:5-(carboxyamino)imidazole ribonucleotide synthase